MNKLERKTSIIINYSIVIVLLTAIAFGLRPHEIKDARLITGLIPLSFGYVLLFCFVFAKLLKKFKLPLITGYIFGGIILGPHISGFLNIEMVGKLQVIDDLALSFIAMNAGGELHLDALKNRLQAIIFNVFFQVTIIFCCVYLFIVYCGHYFSFTAHLLNTQIIALAILLGVIAIARSPASTIAIINETRASGKFTETVLGVTVLKDVFIIILFTIAMSVARIIVSGEPTINYYKFLSLFGEIIVAILIGMIFGKGFSIYIEKIGHDIIIFLLIFGFGITKISLLLSGFMEAHYRMSVHLEPLLICISCGYTIQNHSPVGEKFLLNLDKVALPIYLFFFSIAGARLDFTALKLCWPLALCFVIVRLFGVFSSTWLAGWLSKDEPIYNRNAWMAYITQAGVAIGLGKIAGRQFPEIGVYLNTIVLAVIAVNQIIGPILFKKSLQLVGEAKGG